MKALWIAAGAAAAIFTAGCAGTNIYGTEAYGHHPSREGYVSSNTDPYGGINFPNANPPGAVGSTSGLYGGEVTNEGTRTMRFDRNDLPPNGAMSDPAYVPPRP